jgi:hypothetical protein
MWTFLYSFSISKPEIWALNWSTPTPRVTSPTKTTKGQEKSSRKYQDFLSFVNGTERFKKCKQLFEYQHLLLNLVVKVLIHI